MGRLKIWVASILVVTLITGMLPFSEASFSQEVAAGVVAETPAASPYVTIKSWDFTDGVGNWAKSAWSSTGLTGSVAAEDGRLKFNADYTTITKTYYQGDIQLSESADYSEVTNVSLELLCKTGDEQPKKLEVLFVKSGTEYSKASVAMTDISSTETLEINGVQYTKYNVSMALPTSETDIMYRKNTVNLIFQVVRSGATFNGDVYFDNIALRKESAAKAVLSNPYAVYGQEISAQTEEIADEPTAYQWSKASTYTGAGTEITGAEGASYTPVISDVGGWIYCDVVAGGQRYTTKRVRVAAGSEQKETAVSVNQTTVSNGIAFLTNTKNASGSFDSNKLMSGGYFYLEYSGTLTGVPQFELATWSGTRSTVDITAFESGSVEGQTGIYYAKYSYEDCVAKWGNEDFSELKALRIMYAGADSANLTVSKVSWIGCATSYGELGEELALRQSAFLYTKHVGGDFDASQIREDSYFYVEYQGDADAVSFVANSHSYELTKGSNAYVTIQEPYESGVTGNGYYSIFTAAQIKAAFGDQFRYIDQIRINVKSDKNATSKTLYFFEGNGALVDDISEDGYADVIDVPWAKYADCSQDGVVVIGASITQNPLVTPAALSGAPYYNALGGWNTVLDRTDVITYGIGGQTTIDVANRFGEILKYDYKKIIIQCGNNDLGAFNDDDQVVAQEVTSYTRMLDKVREKNAELKAAGKDEIAVSIISLTPTNAEGIQGRILKVNDAIKSLSAGYDFASYIDVYSDFVKSATGSESYPDCTEYHVNMDLVMSDGLHPIAAGYKIWAKYLKEKLASTAEGDTSLVTLSYRMRDGEKKTAVTGFESTKSSGTENTYSVKLPTGTAKDAQFKLYETASDLSASVSGVDAGVSVETDSYGDSYIPVTLTDGKATAKLKVISEDKNSTEYYTVEFSIDDNPYIYEGTGDRMLTVSADTVNNWPYTEYAVSGVGTIYSGAKIEYDVTVENTDFTGIYLETDFNWSTVKADSLTPADFSNNTVHHVVTYIGEDLTSLSGIQIKTGGTNTDYRGKITISNLKVVNGTPATDDDTGDLEETALFDGSNTGTGIVVSVYTSGNIDMDMVTDGGYFQVEYQASQKQDIKLAFSEWDTSRWVEISPTKTGEVSAGVYYARFSYAACVNAYGSSDLSDVDAVSVKSTSEVTVTSLKWKGPAQESDGSYALFKGSKTATGAQALLTYLYTKHVGGEFDTAAINEGSYFTAEYTGEEGNLILALASVSGTTEWVSVAPTMTTTLANGRYLSTFSIADCIAKFGTNLKRLDQIQMYTYGDDGTTITLKSLKYYAGTGAVIDTDGESKWTNKEMNGIGFIGDSIVQNALLKYGDWNTILDRTDCANWGIGGQTTVHVANRIDDMLDGNYEKIVILCGINDIGNGVTQDTTISNYKEIFAKIHEKLPDTTVYVISVLPTREPFYVDGQDKIVAMNTALKTLISDYSYVTYVDCYSAFVGSDGYCIEDYVFDGLHPNETGYGVIASVLNPVLADTKLEQAAITVAGVPQGSIAYGSSFTLKTEGGSGSGAVTYAVTKGSSYVKVDSSSGAVTVTGVGAVEITVTKAGDSTYNAVTKTVSFTTVKANQSTLSIKNAPAKLSAEKTVTLSTKGGSGKGAVTYAVTSGSKYAKVDKKTGKVTVLGIGSVTITATKAADSNYNKATAKVTFKTVLPAKNTKLTIGSLKYQITKSDSKKGTVTCYAPVDKKVTSLSVPATVKIAGISFKVTAIEANSFKSCTKLKTVTIGNNVMTIGSSAFYRCTMLTKVTVGSGVKSIGAKAFYGCAKLKTITIKSTALNSVGSKAISGINSKCVIKVPNKKMAAYQKLFSEKTGFKKTMAIKK